MYKIQYALVLRLECPTSHHQPIAPCQRQESRPHYSLCACEVGPSSSSPSTPLRRRMARRMTRYEHRKSSGHDTGQEHAVDRKRRYIIINILPADTQPQITAHLFGEQRAKPNRAHRAVGAAGARRLLACRSCPGVGRAKGCMRLSQRLWLADASRQSKSAC